MTRRCSESENTQVRGDGDGDSGSDYGPPQYPSPKGRSTSSLSLFLSFPAVLTSCGAFCFSRHQTMAS